MKTKQPSHNRKWWEQLKQSNDKGKKVLEVDRTIISLSKRRKKCYCCIMGGELKLVQNWYHRDHWTFIWQLDLFIAVGFSFLWITVLCFNVSDALLSLFLCSFRRSQHCKRRAVASRSSWVSSWTKNNRLKNAKLSSLKLLVHKRKGNKHLNEMLLKWC